MSTLLSRNGKLVENLKIPIELCINLIERESVTPEDAGCQQVLAERLGKLGFVNENMPFAEVKNLWSKRGQAQPVFLFAGHTDVVPAGNLQKWHSPPFVATEKAGYLYGRGAADMKASLAAMVVATERFVLNYPEHKGSLAFLITSDEEGPFVNGTVRVVETLQQRGQPVDLCVVGEPSSTQQLGDVIKIGRRGSITGNLTVHGHQGHVAYPHLASNAIHRALPVLHSLVETEWDQGNEHFPATSFQIANFNSGTGAGNVIPGEAHIDFNLRYSTELDADTIKDRIAAELDKASIEYDIIWTNNGDPFLTNEGQFVASVQDAIRSVCQIESETSTAGGTSDGRFIAKMGCDIVELGPVNASIHKVNECVKIDDIVKLTKIYEKILELNLL